jgi:hypothetical protein
MICDNERYLIFDDIFEEEGIVSEDELIFDEDLDDFVDLEDEREYEYLEYEY